MELEVRLLRARVWLSQRALGAQDGFLAVTRATKHLEKLTYGTLDATAQQPSEHARRKFESVVLKWSEATASAAASTASVLHVANAECPLPRIEFSLFMLQVTPERQQRIVFIGRSALRLRAEDANALRSQHEIVFSTLLDGDLGSLDVKVSTRSTDARHSADGDADNEEHRDGRGGAAAFSVNWSSSEALQRDLAVKARLQAEGDAKLLLQLRKVVARALHAVDVRDQTLRRRRLWWAAVRIQRAFRALLRRRREERERARREQLAQQEARKARARAAVVERNLRRAQTMREQLTRAARRLPAVEPVSAELARELTASVRKQAETCEREQLRRTLATIDDDHQRRVASHAAASPTSTVAAAAAAAAAAEPIVERADADLVRGIHMLYFGSKRTMT